MLSVKSKDIKTNSKSAALLVYIFLAIGAVFIFFGGKLIFARAETQTSSPSASPAPTISVSPVACSAEVKLCSDGSAVGRTGPKCEFAPCPEGRGKHEDQNDDDQEEQEVKQAEHDEGDIHQNLNNTQEQLKKITVPDVEISQLNTYGDAINTLKAFQGAIADIKKASTTQDQITGSLSEQERTLFNRLFNKHNVGFSVLDARLKEVSGQIQELIDLLTPIADKTIPDSFGLKRLILAELKGFREQVKDLTDYLDLELEEIDAETF